MKASRDPRVCATLRREYAHMCRLVKGDTERCVLPPHSLIDRDGVVALTVPAATSDFYEILVRVNTGQLTISGDVLVEAWARLGRSASERLGECDLVHVDIKPENAVATKMRYAAGAGGVPCLVELDLALIDLGSSRKLGEEVPVDELGFSSENAPADTHDIYVDWCQRQRRGERGPAPKVVVGPEMDAHALNVGARMVAAVTAHAKKIAERRAADVRRARQRQGFGIPGAPRKARMPPTRQISPAASPDPLRTPEKRRRSEE